MSERGEIKTFRDLIVWQKAHEMDLRVIELVMSFPREQPFRVIGDQLLRSSTSISANIAEGHGSYRGKEYGRFLSYALRSTYETENWLLKLQDSRVLRPRVNVESLKSITDLNTEIIKMLTALLKKMNRDRSL
jgi:four helix bundle protein